MAVIVDVTVIVILATTTTTHETSRHGAGQNKRDGLRLCGSAVVVVVVNVAADGAADAEAAVDADVAIDADIACESIDNMITVVMMALVSGILIMFYSGELLCCVGW